MCLFSFEQYRDPSVWGELAQCQEGQPQKLYASALQLVLDPGLAREEVIRFIAVTQLRRYLSDVAGLGWAGASLGRVWCT